DMSLIFLCYPLRLATATPYLHSFPTRRSSDLGLPKCRPSLCPYIKTRGLLATGREVAPFPSRFGRTGKPGLSSLCAQAAPYPPRSEEHTSELQSRFDLVCRLLLEKKKNDANYE